jgi:hypothetical protein
VPSSRNPPSSPQITDACVHSIRDIRHCVSRTSNLTSPWILTSLFAAPAEGGTGPAVSSFPKHLSLTIRRPSHVDRATGRSRRCAACGIDVRGRRSGDAALPLTSGVTWVRFVRVQGTLYGDRETLIDWFCGLESPRDCYCTSY